MRFPGFFAGLRRNACQSLAILGFGLMWKRLVEIWVWSVEGRQKSRVVYQALQMMKLKRSALFVRSQLMVANTSFPCSLFLENPYKISNCTLPNISLYNMPIFWNNKWTMMFCSTNLQVNYWDQHELVAAVVEQRILYGLRPLLWKSVCSLPTWPY